MHKQLMVGGAMCVATVVLIFAGSARAEPPRNGTMVSFHRPMIVCEKADYLKDLIAAQKTSSDAFGEKAKELISDKHLCTAAQITNVIVGETEDVGNVTWGETQEHLWIVNIIGADFQKAALYEEAIAIKHDTSI